MPDLLLTLHVWFVHKNREKETPCGHMCITTAFPQANNSLNPLDWLNMKGILAVFKGSYDILSSSLQGSFLLWEAATSSLHFLLSISSLSLHPRKHPEQRRTDHGCVLSPAQPLQCSAHQAFPGLIRHPAYVSTLFKLSCLKQGLSSWQAVHLSLWASWIQSRSSLGNQVSLSLFSVSSLSLGSAPPCKAPLRPWPQFLGNIPKLRSLTFLAALSS